MTKKKNVSGIRKEWEREDKFNKVLDDMSWGEIRTIAQFMFEKMHGSSQEEFLKKAKKLKEVV